MSGCRPMRHVEAGHMHKGAQGEQWAHVPLGTEPKGGCWRHRPAHMICPWSVICIQHCKGRRTAKSLALSAQGPLLPSLCVSAVFAPW